MSELEAEKGYSGFERFMFFVTPILFTIVLLGVLLTLFNFDLRNKVLTVGDSIPFLNEVLPDPVTESETSAGDGENADAGATAKAAEEQNAVIAQLKQQLSAKEKALQEATGQQTVKDKQIGDLQNQVKQLSAQKEESDTSKLSDEEYAAKIKALADTYAKMSPSKAAPIMEAMELDEAVLVLNSMRTDDQAKVLEKMTPKTAAEATVKLKDIKSAKDQQIAALQARLNKQTTTTEEPSSSLSTTQLKDTFTNMPAANAAELLIKMSEVSPSKVLRILNAVDSSARSSILSEMSSLNEGITAQLVSKLMTGK
ncbi:MotE family protein [Paenibacillus methanolicus]|uniref:Flagellar motility protein MotE (MotC chaperone) n=1 Tax=Paenibacillus methanolicus TaxID=582686 RepID=A0A5S5CI11_9BACL|nr:MgtE protein [Paenibacillus methanolicus]TYP77653.1 flagellar motility protein MotE (MotC chaperone) [Paenibacillus methanolicus]